MGFLDRPYYGADNDQPLSMFRGRSTVTILIAINVACFLINALLGRVPPAAPWVPAELQAGDRLFGWMALTPDALIAPWRWWQFVTYAFAHDPSGLGHIGFNMLALFFIGPAVEQRLGSREFLRFYLLACVLGGVVWALRAFLLGGGARLLGASGAVDATLMLFIFFYPQVEILLFFVLPVRAWVLGVLMVIFNLLGAGATTTAHDVHLAGMAFAAAYYFGGWRLENLWPPASIGRWVQNLRRPRLKLHNPQRREAADADEADRILRKIHEQGEASLTKHERLVLERYSRQMRERRRS
jgi:membrane associated rhomboid family serine protease